MSYSFFPIPPIQSTVSEQYATVDQAEGMQMAYTTAGRLCLTSQGPPADFISLGFFL